MPFLLIGFAKETRIMNRELMKPLPPKTTKNCVGQCRTSTLKQQQEGDSLDVQEASIRGMAEANGWNIVPNNQVWRTAISGRKTERDDFEEILAFIKAHPGLVDFYVFRCIDRATRAGSGEYLRMKSELEKCCVQMVDTYGIIQPTINTMAEFGLEYSWSRFSPSAVTETVFATTANQEVTNILTRMQGQAVRNTRNGYRTRRPTDGFKNQKIFDEAGKKKYIQAPDEDRAKFRIAMFELRQQGLSDEKCVERINAMGYLSPVYHKWNKEHNKIIGTRGGKPMTIKQFQRDTRNTLYAGVVCEKWTHYKPIRAKYDGLVSIEQWNRANKGKVALMEKPDGTLELVEGSSLNKHGKGRLKNNPLFPYKFIQCPHCNKSILGSSPRGKLGKPHATYHCARTHKYFGVPKTTFEENVEKFINGLEFNPDVLLGLEATFINKFRQREQEIVKASGNIHQNIADLENEQAMRLEAYTSSKSAIVREKLEKEIEALEVRIKSAGNERIKIQITRDDIKEFMAEAKKIMEHPAEILLNQEDIRVQRDLFSLVFEKTPTYAEIVSGTPKLSYIFNLSFKFASNQSQLVNS